MLKISAMEYEETAPLFGLYGDPIQALEPGFVHIEDVAVRSRALDWRIASHRHANLLQVLSIFDGSAKVQFDDHFRTLDSGSVIVIPPGVVHAFRFQPVTKGAVLTIADEMLREDGELAHIEALQQAPQVIAFEPSESQLDLLRHYLEAIANELKNPATGRHLMLGSLIRIVLTLLVRRLEETRLTVAAGIEDSKILTGFRRLVELHYASQWPVSRYAAALNTSISSLNRRCRRYVGLTAKSIIQNRVLMEAKRRLIYTREPVESVAFSLGFNDPAYFSRFFRKWERVPPGQYRRSAGQLRQ
jgi:AraC family transcriptional activator of pobA